MRKILSAILCIALLAGTISGCGNTASSDSNQNDTEQNNNDTLSIVTTIFPEYDWVREILGDQGENVELTLLLDNGVELHSYQPTADDMVKIADCDLFIYVGGESDEWVEDALTESAQEDRVVINLLDILGDSVKEEEVVEGMEEEEDTADDPAANNEDSESIDDSEDIDNSEDTGNTEDIDDSEYIGNSEDTDDLEYTEDSEDTDDSEDNDHPEGEAEYDEHVWLSLRNAQVLCQYISDRLCEIDEANRDTYSANTADYLEKLTALDAQYETVVANAARTTLLFGDRFPFRYLVDDYGLSYYAAFVGCSAETEASFETIAFLAGKVDELGLTTVLTLEGTDGKIAETIISTADSEDVQILSMDSMQSTTSAAVNNGATYLSLMENNLDVLTQALH